MPSTNKATIYYQTDENDTKLNGQISVMFNPNTYSISRNVHYTGNNNNNKANKYSSNSYSEDFELKNYPNLNYAGGSSDTLSLELIFNKYDFKHYSKDIKYNSEDLDITKNVKDLEKLTLAKANLHKPPKCRFEWSSFSFQGYISSFNVTYNMFLEDGTPVRAKVALTIIGAELGNDVKVPYESPDRTKNRLINENQQLWEIAYNEYGDATMWREIAKANNIKNPLYLKSGTRLIVPAITKSID